MSAEEINSTNICEKLAKNNMIDPHPHFMKLFHLLMEHGGKCLPFFDKNGRPNIGYLMTVCTQGDSILVKKAIDNYDCDKSGTILQQKFVENVEGADLEIIKGVFREIWSG